jgi:hypothetical protein
MKAVRDTVSDILKGKIKFAVTNDANNTHKVKKKEQRLQTNQGARLDPKNRRMRTQA